MGRCHHLQKHMAVWNFLSLHVLSSGRRHFGEGGVTFTYLYLVEVESMSHGISHNKLVTQLNNIQYVNITPPLLNVFVPKNILHQCICLNHLFRVSLDNDVFVLLRNVCELLVWLSLVCPISVNQVWYFTPEYLRKPFDFGQRRAAFHTLLLYMVCLQEKERDMSFLILCYFKRAFLIIYSII